MVASRENVPKNLSADAKKSSADDAAVDAAYSNNSEYATCLTNIPGPQQYAKQWPTNLRGCPEAIVPHAVGVQV